MGAVGPSCAAQAVTFSRDIQPILAKHCFACHGPDLAEYGLALHEPELAFADTDSGRPAIIRGDPDGSALIQRVSSADPSERMPPDTEPLSDNEVKLLEAWIADGAGYEAHWAFVPRKAVTPPSVSNESWVSTPIDRFILARLESAGLAPAERASPSALLRRLYYDVTGLPPPQEAVNRFLDDSSPLAYSRLVDRLLASPQYGEKWARHWLDLVRYAESNSFERDATKPYAWKYRDYVIRSLNNDKPYDQFVREQLAGDELEPLTPDGIVATGYYRLGTWDDEPADPLQSRFDDLDNILSTTTQAFLGLTVECARCHDHKIDPIAQEDYYRLLAFFADVTPYALPNDRSAHLHSLWDLSPAEVQRRRAEQQEEQRRLTGVKSELERLAIERMEGPDQHLTETDQRDTVLQEKLADHQSAEERAQYEGVLSDLESVTQSLSDLPEPDWALSLAKCDPDPPPMHVRLRGNAHARGDPVEPGYPELFGSAEPHFRPTSDGSRSAGRRKVLADWIANADNLLTSRVIANRVWQHHFGRGIVRSANNFGRIGTAPTHPDLLDWLAGYLIEKDWSLKSLHRLILNSSAYKMSSGGNADALAIDPENNLFWRFDMRRLSAEEIRDSVLSVAGQLNDRQYGPSIYPELSQEVLATQSRPGHDWHTSTPRDAARRSIYIHVKRSVIPPELAAFDFPNPDASCEARFNTTQAAQALTLLHGGFMRAQAGCLSERVQLDAGGSLRDQVAWTLSLCLQRDPDEASIRDGLALIDRLTTEHGLDSDGALREFCLMVMNLNEFVYLD